LGISTPLFEKYSFKSLTAPTDRQLRRQCDETRGLTVYHVTTGLEEEKLIELSEKRCGRLMDSAQDSLTSRRELSQEGDDEERRLTIETGSRLIQEQ
jgi:hypothetical protein